MEEQSANVFQELKKIQSKIEFLFLDLVNERDEHKLNLEKSEKNFEKVSGEISSLKKRNQTLQESNEELKKIIVECFRLFTNLDLSGQSLNKNGKHVLDVLQNNFRKINKKIESLPLGELDVKIKIEYDNVENEGTTSRLRFEEEMIKKEIESISNLNFSTEFFQDDETRKVELTSNKNKSESISEKMLEWESNVKEEKKVDEPLARKTKVSLTNSHHLNESDDDSYTALCLTMRPQKATGARSPVFKDLGNRKQDNLSGEENVGDASRTPSSKLVNEKYFLGNSPLFISPLKRPSSQIESSPSPKRRSPMAKRFRKLESPKKTSSSQLKKSSYTEPEISAAGVRKFTQTMLNLEYFKKHSQTKESDASYVENVTRQAVADETKLAVDGEEDDIIWESPKIPGQMLEGLGGKNQSKKTQFLAPVSTSGDTDLDETYVSFSAVKKLKLTGLMEHVLKENAPASPKRDRSPEYDSVPFIYKREPVRKKAERMKLPGHTCLECQKYYREALESDMTSQDIQKILNKCSRHRDQNPPSVDDTPPGYWKPYLTATNVISPGKNEPVTR